MAASPRAFRVGPSASAGQVTGRSPGGHPPESQDRNVAGRARKAGGNGGWSPGGLRVGARPKAQADGRVPEDDRHHHDSERSHGSARGRAISTEGAALVASACRVICDQKEAQKLAGEAKEVFRGRWASSPASIGVHTRILDICKTRKF